ncbi:MAG: hypothetical protein KDN05_25045, partial [Verrucomicrobiae bacterium]|nr:hypothetical protein [Verrucomicrobiae bacterium]
GLAMLEFESEYGSFPNDETAAAVKETSGMTLPVKPKTADDCFYQLFAAGIIDDLRIFSFEEPRRVAPSKAKKGPEKATRCSFSYVSGMNAAGHPGRPLVMTPMVSGKTTFDPKPLGGKAFVLFCDNSVRAFPIEADGRVLMAGKDLFDPAQPFWNGKVPPIKWPDSSQNAKTD